MASCGCCSPSANALAAPWCSSATTSDWPRTSAKECHCPASTARARGRLSRRPWHERAAVHRLAQRLALASGRPFDASLDGLYDTVIGAEVADALGYRLGQHITLSHGAGRPGGIEHADKPFTVAGILKRTGTPVDRTVHISLEAME